MSKGIKEKWKRFYIYIQIILHISAEIIEIKRNIEFIFTGVTILLSLTVFLNMVAETMPATSDAVPLLGK